MPPISFVTTNPEKFAIAKVYCQKAGIALEQLVLEIDEIQGSDTEEILRHKARQAFELCRKPIIVSDDSWHIAALNGFPGPYMKSINHWFTPDDFLRLMHGVTNRDILLRQQLAYQDDIETVTFSCDITGKMLTEVRGNNRRIPLATVIALDRDNGKSLADVFAENGHTKAERYKDGHDAWSQLIDWYIKKNT